MIPFVLALILVAGVTLFYQGTIGLSRPAGRPAVRQRLVAALAAWSRGVQEFLTRAGLQDVTPRDFLVFSLGAGVVAGLSTQLLLGWGTVTVLATAIGLIGPFGYYVHRHDQRRAIVQDTLADAISQLRDSIRTGLSVPEALLGLAQHGPVPLRPEFTRLVRDMRFDGFEPALDAMRRRLADPLFDVVAVSLTINDRLGGRNVSQVLDQLAHATRAQLQVQRELRAHQARHVLSARVVAALPLALLVAIRRINPAYVALFDGAWGQLILAGCVVSITLGYAGMLWLTRLPSEPRILADESASRRAPFRLGPWGRGGPEVRQAGPADLAAPGWVAPLAMRGDLPFTKVPVP